MKRILCPVDFSDASKTGIEFAGQLAKKISAGVTLFHVRISIWPEAIQLEEQKRMSNESMINWLSDFSDVVRNEFEVPCHYTIHQTTDTFAEAVAAQAHLFDLIVMGTNGADNAYDFVFGSNTFQVIQKSKCPVFIIPEGYRYCSIDRIIYAHDPDTNPIFLIDQLRTLSAKLDAEIRVLCIEDKGLSNETKRKMEILHDAIQARLSGKVRWSFDGQYSQDVWEALDKYVKPADGDVLALFFHHRSLLEQLFNENVVRKITMVADYPVFVFWH